MIPRAAWYLVTKSERAKLHLDAFNGHVAEYMKKPYTIIRNYDAQNRRHIKRIKESPFDSTMALELGEFLYCLRSGLDQMAWQMAKPESRRDFPKSVYFPIPEELSTAEHRRNYRKALLLFPDGVAKELEALNPHNGPDPPQSHPLWQLNKLSNFEKHKLIPIHSTTINLFVPGVPGVKVDYIESENATEISVPEEFENTLDLKPTTPGPIEVGEWNSDWGIPIHRLSDIHGFITCTVIPRFMPFNLAEVPAEPFRIC